MTSDILIRLKQAEALVLFEWLVRNNEAKALSVEDPAEEQVLWRIEGQLESTLGGPFASNYRELVEAARAEVKRDTAPR